MLWILAFGNEMNAIDNVVCKSTSHDFNLAGCLLVVHIMKGNDRIALKLFGPE